MKTQTISSSGAIHQFHRLTIHTPVLLKEVLEYLNPGPGKNYIDATADGGGHAMAIIKAIQPDGKLLALEWDETLFDELTKRLKKECLPFSKNYELRRTSYAGLEAAARSSRFGQASGVLFDLGLSSFHLEASRRGFSFRGEEPLDMRYSPADTEMTAAEILKRASAEELAAIIRDYGEERFAKAIAKAIVAERRRHSIRTTADLVRVVRAAVPRRYLLGRIHFATRTFQAIRIAVNGEFENITKGLEAARRVLAPGGRIVIISFHSLEDRIIKNFFRADGVCKEFIPIVKKPVRPGLEEIRSNPRSRSARMRVFEKIT